jgi:hypothetical protein
VRDGVTGETPRQHFEFDGFCADAGKRCLTRGGQLIPLTSKAFDTLLLLVTHRGQALVYAGLREIDVAFEWLRRAKKEHDVHLVFLTVDPKWDFLRSDPRFSALLDDCCFMRG